MSRDNPWTKHRQSFWQEKAGSPCLPLWQRIAFLAYGVHRRNGHAPFKPGEIRLALSLVDTSTGEIKQPSRTDVSHAIKLAINYGFLHQSSNARCLVVPPWGIEGGLLGKTSEVCGCHSHTRKPRKVVSETQPNCASDTTLKPLTCGDTDALYDSSQDRNLSIVRDHGATA